MIECVNIWLVMDPNKNKIENENNEPIDVESALAYSRLRTVV